MKFTQFFKNIFLKEEIKAFKNKGNTTTDIKISKEQGEGFEMMGIQASANGLKSFNMFYKDYLNKDHANNQSRIQSYREMATMPEISDIIEDAVNESTQEDDNGNVFSFQIVNEKFFNNENITKILTNEFNNLMFNTLNLNTEIWKLFNDFMIDGALYYERIINISKHKEGIKNIKKLPPESMDYLYNYKLSKIVAFLQYLKPNVKKPKTIEEAKNDANIIVFIPEQIGFIPYRFGKNKSEIFGYLENCKVAYNQLKLLETSVIIYRLVRAPERFVFKIDVGNMPKDKALKYVNKIKNQMNRKQSYNPQTGVLEGTTNINSILDNIWIPQSDTRGSDVTTVGGNSAGFTELDDVKYFARKLYRSLKYPMSRIDNSFENNNGDNLFRGPGFAEISRDEIKWSRFLERIQNKFCTELKNLFLLHTEFIGLKKQYNLDKFDFNIIMNPPSDYKEQMKQQLLETRFNNYTQLSNEQEFSKTYLMRTFLKMDDDELKGNLEGHKEDKKNIPKEDTENY